MTRPARRIAAACLPLLLAVEAAAKKPLVIRWIQIHDPIVVADRAAKDFAARIEKATNGEVRVEVITKPQYEKAAGRTMSNVGVMREVAEGKGDMCQIYTHSLAKFDRRLLALGMPYLFRDYAHAEAVIEGPIGRGLLGPLAEHGILHGLGITYSGGFGIVSTKGVDARDPAALKGLRMLTSRQSYATAIKRTLDIEPVVAGPNAYVPLAEHGLVDAAETTMTCFDMYEDHRKADTIADTRHFLLTSMIVVNGKFFKKLPEKYRALIKREALVTAREERAASIAASAKSREKISARGVRILELTPAQKKAYETALAGQYAEIRFPPDFLDAIRNTGDLPVAAAP